MGDIKRDDETLYIDGYVDRRTKTRRFAESTFVAGSVSGRLVDVSEAGLGLEAEQALPVLHKGTFTLGIGKARPQFRGEVRWCRLVSASTIDPDAKGLIYRAGVSLIPH